MIEYKGASIHELFLKKIKNENETSPHLLQNEFTPSEEETLKNIFLKPLVDSVNIYEFQHEVDLELNVLFQLSRQINTDKTIGNTHEGILSHLRSSSRHPNIKEGDLFLVLFNDLVYENAPTAGLGIFKVEKKDTFIETPDWTKEPTLLFKEGIGERKLDKACLILFTEEPFTLLAYDNNSSEAIYWKNDFIHLALKDDHVNETHHFLQMAKKYITEQMPEEFELSRTDQIDLLNKSISYFKETDEFDKGEFELSVFGQEEEAIHSFKYFDKQYQEEMGMEISDHFKIATHAVKKQARVFKSVLKLDKNFHVYIHGNRDLIEKGQEVDGRKYYKIYYENEC